MIDSPRDVKHLKEIVSRFSVYAQVDDEGVVSVENMVGSAQYLSKSPEELTWLKLHSYEIEPRGYITKYYIKF
jgi:hypothetical protein